LKNFRGFTLIELLAVILILGIIALIAIPIVNNIIKESKRGAFETTAYNVISAIEDACQLQVLQDQAIVTTYTFTDGNVSPPLNIKGKLPTEGTVTVNSVCNTSASLTNGTFTASKDADSDDITITDGDQVVIPIGNNVYANGAIVYFDPVGGTKCAVADYAANAGASTTGNKTGCMKWYTFNDGGAASDTIDMILDHNTTAVVAWNISGNNTAGPTDVLTQLQNDTATWSNTLTVASSNNITQQTNSSANNYVLNYTGYRARLLTADEVATITGNTTWTQANTASTNYFLDSKTSTASPTCTTGDTSNCNYDWLYDRTATDCTTFGCLNNADASMTGNGYWTSSANNLYPAYAWRVLKNALFNHDSISSATEVGVRPVITVSKSVIK